MIPTDRMLLAICATDPVQFTWAPRAVSCSMSVFCDVHGVRPWTLDRKWHLGIASAGLQGAAR
jgi:hypothetical protein